MVKGFRGVRWCDILGWYWYNLRWVLGAGVDVFVAVVELSLVACFGFYTVFFSPPHLP